MRMSIIRGGRAIALAAASVLVTLPVIRPENVVAGDAPEQSLPPFKIERNLDPATLSKRVASLKSVFPCKGCKGTGKATKREKVGDDHRNGLVYPIYRATTVNCGACDGRCYGNPDQVRARLRDVVDAWARVKRLDHEEVRATDQAKRGLTDLCRLNRVEAVKLANQSMISLYAGANFDAGEPLYLIGNLIAISEGPLDADRSFTISLSDHPEMYVVVQNPIGVDALGGEEVIAGGLFLGLTQTKINQQAAKAAVIAEGFVFAIDRQ